jgi:hypothetical protein
MNTDDSTRRNAEQDDIDEEGLRRRYDKFSDWSEPGAVKVNRDAQLQPMVCRWKRSLSRPRSRHWRGQYSSVIGPFLARSGIARGKGGPFSTA